jgi:hypothetical protein
MKKTVELDTLDICDRLQDLSGQLRVLALACNSLGDTNSARVANMIFDVASLIHDIGDEVHPSPPIADKIVAMRNISEARLNRKINAEIERAKSAEAVT